MSLAVVGVTSLFGAFGHWRAGNVNLRVALIFGAVAMVGTFIGARLSVFVSGSVQLLLFAFVMLLAAFFMFRGRSVATPEPGGQAVGMTEMPIPKIVIEGLVVGIVTGLVGVGGGFLVVPALVLLGKVPMKQAVGTSLLVIAMKSASGFVGYLDQVSVDWGTVTTFSGVAIVGILIGTTIVRFIPQEALRRSFATFLVVMGIVIVFQNSGVHF
jgi:uncharacterized membrane protein YfcA